MSKKVLVTGASGFVASAIVREFLTHGYDVVGTVRSQSKADQITRDLSEYGDKLRFSIVPDMCAPGAFDEAVKGVDGVIHTASPYQVSGVNDVEEELLQPAISGATGVLKSIKKNNASVRRVVFTSSFAAVSGGVTPKDNIFTEKDWCQFTYEQGKTSPPFIAYVASKALAERAAWNFVENEKPNFTLATICPPFIYGPVLQPVDRWEGLNTSSKDLRVLVDGSSKEVPSTLVPFWIDVRDVAAAHRLAFEKEEAAGQRYLISGGKNCNEDISDVLIANFPALRSKIPARQPGQPDKPSVNQIDSSKAVRELGLHFRSLKECIVDSAQSLIKLEEKLGN